MLGELVELEQGTDEWLEHRKGKFTGSAVAAIMDQAKYKPRTFREYWLWRKGQLVLEDIGSFADWGHAQEPIARNRINRELGIDHVPMSFVYQDLMASLDGFNFEANSLLEIKCPAKGKKSATWKYVEEHGEPPLWYIWQMVMGHHLTDSQHNYFYVYDGNTGDALPVIDVSNNYLSHLWHDELAPAIERMRQALLEEHAPGEILDPTLIKKADRLKVVLAEKKALDDEEKGLKDELKKASGGENAWCSGVSIAWHETTRFNKKKAEEAGLPLDKFQTTSKSARITV